MALFSASNNNNYEFKTKNPSTLKEHQKILIITLNPMDFATTVHTLHYATFHNKNILKTVLNKVFLKKCFE